MTRLYGKRNEGQLEKAKVLLLEKVKEICRYLIGFKKKNSSSKSDSSVEPD
jgi:hypothetical protein